jgi:hypothetical protein
MTMKRKAIHHPPRTEIPPAAITAFRKIQKLHAECSCPPRNWTKYWEHQPCENCEKKARQMAIIRDELHLPPWMWPCVQSPDDKNPYPAWSVAARQWQPYPEAQTLWQILEEAAAESD